MTLEQALEILNNPLGIQQDKRLLAQAIAVVGGSWAQVQGDDE